MKLLVCLALAFLVTKTLVAGLPEGAILCVRGDASFTLATGTFESLGDQPLEVEAVLFDSTDRFDFLDDTSSFPMDSAAGFTMRSADGELVFASSSYSLVSSVFATTTVSISGLDDRGGSVLGILQINCPAGVVDIKSLPALIAFLQDLPESCEPLLILDQRTVDGVLGEAEGPSSVEAGATCDDGPPDAPPPPRPLVPTAPQEPVVDDAPCEAACAVPCRVYLHSGEEHYERVDLTIPGRGDIHFEMRRSYRSRLDHDGPLGHGWDFVYNETLFPEPDGDVLRANGAGHVDRWTRNEDGTYTAPAGFFRALVKEPDGSFVMRSADGFERRYRADGRLSAHVDRHGNTMGFEHDERGNLARVVDVFGRVVEFEFESFPDGRDRLVRVRDFAGRELVYSYDERGDLVSARSPIVTGTSTGNDFPGGRTERYAYASGDGAPELAHNLVSVTHAEEVATGGPPALTWVYGEDPDDPRTFDRVVRLGIGGGRVNASGVPAGGDFVFEYESLDDAAPGDPDVPCARARVTERNGNVAEYFVNQRNQHILTRRLTRGLREGEPEAFETRSFFDADHQLVRRVFPAGNEIHYAYASRSRFAARNLVEIRRVADAARGGGEDLVTTFTYEPLYNQLASVTDPRGNSTSFTPPLGEASAARYTTRSFFDYQEGDGPVAAAERWGIDLSGIARGLGDLNGDGRTDRSAGDVVRRVDPSVTLLAGSQEAERLGSTTQEIVTETWWNDHGQALRVIDPEGNVTVNEYWPADDPDGDGIGIPAPRSSDPCGYLRSTTRDAAESPRRLSPIAPVGLTMRYRHDAVGNVIRTTDARGVATDLEVNALDEVLVTTRGAEISEAVASGELITGEEAFGYRVRRTHDHDGRVVRIEIENRADVSTTAGVGDFVDRTYTYDLLGNVVRETVEVDADTTLVRETRFDESELPVLRIEPEGNRTQVRYDERDLAFEITRGLGAAVESTTRHDHDLNGLPERVTDAEDNDGDGLPESTLHEHDGFDRLVATIDALGNRSETAYDVASNVVRVRHRGHPPGDPDGTVVLLSDVRHHHDELDRVYQTDRALFLAEGFEPVRAVDLRDGNSDGLVTERVEHDRASRVTCTVEDDGEFSRRMFDGADRIVETVDAAGNRVVTRYDRGSNPVEVTSIEVSPEGLVPDETFTTRRVFDQLGRLVRTTDELGQTTRFAHDSRDNLTSRSDPVGPPVDDPLGLFPGENNAPGEINAPGNTVSWHFDGLDRTVREVRDLRVDGEGGGPLDVSNPFNPDGQVTIEQRWDGNSRLVARIDDHGSRTAFEYDALDRRTARIEPDGERYRYVHDRDDNLVEITDPNGSVVTSRHDALNRLVRREISRGPGVLGTTLETYEHDGLGRVTRSSDDNGSPETVQVVTRVFDSLSRVLEEEQRVTVPSRSKTRSFIRADSNADGELNISDALFTLRWLFLGGEVPLCVEAADSNGDRAVNISDPSFSLVYLFLGGTPPGPPFPDCGVAPDGLALGCASDPPCAEEGEEPGTRTGVVSTVWSGDGKPLHTTYPGSRSISREFDAIDHVTALRDGGATIAEFAWIGRGYRELERRCGNGTRSSTLDDAGQIDVGWDGVRRLVRCRVFGPDGTSFLDREYGYDRAGTRTFERRGDDGGQTDRYTHDSLYRIVRTRLDEDGSPDVPRRAPEEVAYVLDGAGNRREREDGGEVLAYTVNEVHEYASIGGVARTHDSNGNLTSDGERSYAYDHENRLVAVTGADTGELVARYLHHADGRRAAKLVGESETLFFHDGLEVCEEFGASEATWVLGPGGIDEPIQMLRDGRAYWLHQNARADVVAVTDAAGRVVEETVYDDFGAPSAPSTIGNPYLFQGRRLDEETGLYHFRRRHYDPASGRFLQRDPVHDPANLGNRYTFVGNGPVSGRDPLGLKEPLIPMGEFSGPAPPPPPPWVDVALLHVRAISQAFAGVRVQLEQVLRASTDPVHRENLEAALSEIRVQRAHLTLFEFDLMRYFYDEVTFEQNWGTEVNLTKEIIYPRLPLAPPPMPRLSLRFTFPRIRAPAPPPTVAEVLGLPEDSPLLGGLPGAPAPRSSFGRCYPDVKPPTMTPLDPSRGDSAVDESDPVHLPQ